MQLAKKITVDRANKRVLIDDVEFPYYLAEDGPEISNPLSNNLPPIVMLPVFAEDLEVIPEDA